jgi:two-component system alkaline phosphatase synthesis response regulator PhoP
MKKRILLVDDEPELTLIFKHRLEADGYYEVLAVNDTTGILDVARKFDPDLILLDIMMPIIDGTELAARFRDDPGFARTPILFLTALVMGKEPSLGPYSSAGQTFVPKDIPMDKLIACIEEKLRTRQAE